MLVCIADLHINCKRDIHFEKARVLALASALLQETSNSLYILGDTFDTDKPTLDDLKLFYHFTNLLKDQYRIHIISGNHDSTCFTYIPEVNFKYYHKKHIGDISLLSWNNLGNLQYIPKCRILMSHARCTIKPYIEEEVDFQLLSTKADLVILGDIHHPVKGLPTNIHYTLEPTSNSYTKETKNSSGYLLVNSKTLEVTRRHPKLPKKILLEFNAIDEFLKYKPKLIQEHKYKVRITDLVENLRVLNVPNVLFEYTPLVTISNTKEEEELRAIVNQKESISEMLLKYTEATYKFSPEVLIKLRQRLRP